jgi:non-ribosomal peptide synthetase component F
MSRAIRGRQSSRGGGPGGPGAHALSRVAAERQGAPALEAGDQCLTYQQLETRVDEIARLLPVKGARPDERVGIAMRRSTDMVAALLAIHRVGAAYVPLDPRYPPARLKFMLVDSDVRTVVTDRESASALPDPLSADLVIADDLAHAGLGDRAYSFRPLALGTSRT